MEQQTTTQPIPLAIPNENNKLQCKFFCHIGKAPSRALRKGDYDHQYVVQSDDASVNGIIFRLIDVKVLLFKEIDCHHTLLSSGVNSSLFKELYHKKNGYTAPETLMAVYYYMKIL